ncbi:MAG: response regulator, partial [Bacteroidota bacterium]
IIVNLLNNAIKFTDKGEVVLSVSMRQDTEEPNFEFEVRDTGIGIPSDRIQQIFQSFSQVDASTTRKYGGTGLGLAISKQLVEMMGGNMGASSSGVAGEGSSFFFNVKLEIANESQHISGLQGPKFAQLQDQRVLIVDDNLTNQKILLQYAQLMKMQARVCGSGAEALQLLERESSFDLAILDMQMPEMDGLQLAAQIRTRFDSASLPMMLLTSIGKLELSQVHHFQGQLTKPIKPEPLANAILSCMSPRKKVSQQKKQTMALPRDLAQKHPLRILLAEDNLVNQKVATRILLKLGYRIDVVANGQEAVEAVRRQEYDLILMDIQMPEMDGMQATRAIHRLLPQPQRPYIIALTANALKGDKETYLAAGMNAYLSKPINLHALIEALEIVPSRITQK